MTKFTVVVTIIVALLLSFCSQTNAKDNLDDIFNGLQLSELKFSRSLLSREEVRIKDSVNVIESLVALYSKLVIVSSLFEDEKKKDKAKILLASMENFIGMLDAFAPKHYREEIHPLLLGQINGKPLPAKPTELQKRLIESGKNDFDDLVREVKKMAAEDKKLLEKGLEGLRLRMIIIDKKIMELEKK